MKAIHRILALLGVLVLAAAPAVHAQTVQTVRVVATRAEIRLHPRPDSVVVIAVDIGTVLEVQGREGDWYLVALPPDPQGLRRSGYIAVTDVETRRPAEPPTAPVAAPPTAPQAPPPTSDGEGVEFEVGARVGVLFNIETRLMDIYGTVTPLFGGEAIVWFHPHFGIQGAVDFTTTSGTPMVYDLTGSITSVQDSSAELHRTPISISGVYRTLTRARFYAGGGLAIVPYNETGHVTYVEYFTYTQTASLEASGTATGAQWFAGVQFGNAFVEFRAIFATATTNDIFHTSKVNVGGPAIAGGFRY